jgi:Zn-dependent protease
MEFIFLLIVLLASVIIHEVSHGYAALFQGDRTAYYMGRLTLNPLAHLDPLGSVILPFFLYISSGVIFGWAKPVPYNPLALRDFRWGPVIVALAGPASNIALAVLAGGLIQVLSHISPTTFQSIIHFLAIIVRVNVVLAVFNLVPIPPLDGSKLLFAILPYSMSEVKFFLEQYGIIFLFIFILFGFHLIFPIINFLFRIITGGLPINF